MTMVDGGGGIGGGGGRTVVVDPIRMCVHVCARVFVGKITRVRDALCMDVCGFVCGVIVVVVAVSRCGCGHTMCAKKLVKLR